MKEFVEYIVKELVDNTLEVDVNEVNKDQRIVYEVSVAEAEISKVIGKRGQTVQAIRTLLNAIAAKTSKRASIEILEK